MNKSVLFIAAIGVVILCSCKTHSYLDSASYYEQAEEEEYDDQENTGENTEETIVEETPTTVGNENTLVFDGLDSKDLTPIEETPKKSNDTTIEKTETVNTTPAETTTDSRYSHDYNNPAPVVEEKKTQGDNVTKRVERVSVTQGSYNYEQKPFCIIFGSFSQHNNAINFRNKLLAEGFSECCVLKNEMGMFRVSAVGFQTEKEARSRLLNLRGEYPEFADCWLLVTKR